MSEQADTSFRPIEAPSDGVIQAKAALRAQVRNALRNLAPEYRARASSEACQRLARQEAWRTATRILCYAPRGDEVDISPLVESALAEGKLVALPRFDRDSRVYSARLISCSLSKLAPGYFGIREPDPQCPAVSMKQLDFVMVPGVAFDLDGRRLGHGRGYYDRLLEDVRGVKCGVAFEEQIRVRVPVESHDVLVDCLLTPARWLDFRKRGLG